MKTSQKIKATIFLVIVAMIAVVWVKLPIRYGLDLQGGSYLILEAKDTPTIKVDNDAVLGVLTVIRERIDGLGISEPVIRRKGYRQIVVELPGIKDPQRAERMIGDTAQLEFVEGIWAPGDVQALTPEQLEILAGPGARVDTVKEYDNAGRVISERAIILKDIVLTGADLKSGDPGTNQYGEPVVNIEFKTEGARKFRDVTTRMVGKPLAIILDGKIISAPNVREPITSGRAQISGDFSVQEMRDLVIKLKAGALPVPVEIISKKTIGPTLGRDSLVKSRQAGIIGFGLVVLYMILFYQLPGLMAGLALVMYVFGCLACLKVFHATLTLPGIAGLILTIGMAVDANVIIFERIKEEKRAGQTLLNAISLGFARAFPTIFDSNVTTLIAAVVLFWLGVGPIRGFAVTLSIGILVSMFTAIFVTRLFVDGFVGFVKEKIFFRV